MPKCKICKQHETWLYWILRGKLCVHCDLTLDGKLHPIEVTKEQIKKMEISERAVDDYYKEHFH